MAYHNDENEKMTEVEAVAEMILTEIKSTVPSDMTPSDVAANNLTDEEQIESIMTEIYSGVDSVVNDSIKNG